MLTKHSCMYVDLKQCFWQFDSFTFKGSFAASIRRRRPAHSMFSLHLIHDHLTPSHEFSSGCSTKHPETSGGPEITSQ